MKPQEPFRSFPRPQLPSRRRPPFHEARPTSKRNPRYLRLAEKSIRHFGLRTALNCLHALKKPSAAMKIGRLRRRLKGALEEWGQPLPDQRRRRRFLRPENRHPHPDALGRTWQCGTVQLDMALPEKFDLEYMDQDGALKRPVMLAPRDFWIDRKIFWHFDRTLCRKIPSLDQSFAKCE